MSVGSVTSVVASANADDSASVLVAKKALDVQRQQGETIVRMLETAKVEGEKGYHVDIMV